MSMRAGGNPDIYVMRANGSRVRRLTSAPGEDCCPEWSPNGKRIVFQSHRTGQFDIACAQHCGTNHYKMKGLLTVLPEDEYARWAAEARTWLQYRVR